MAGDFSEAMMGAVREMQIRGRAVLRTGTEITVDSSDIVSIRISEGSDSGIMPGSVLSAACTIVLNNEGGKWQLGDGGYLSILGSVFEMEIGVKAGEEWLYEPLGVFVCRDAAADEGSTVMTLTMSDYLDAMGNVAFEDGLEYPCHLGEVWQHILEQTGFEWKIDMEAGDAIIDAPPRWGKISVREAMGLVAQVAGTFVRIDRTGNLDIVPVKGRGEALEIGPQHYMSRSRCDGYFGPVTGLQISTVNAQDDNDSESEEIMLGEGSLGAYLEISGNPLYITGADHLADVAQRTLDGVAGLEFIESRFTWRGDPSVEPGTRIRIEGLDSNVVESIVSRQTLEFSGGFFAECVCGVPANDGAGAMAWVSGGAIDAERLIGVVPGANIEVESITAGKIAAGAITAEKISAGAIETDKIAAGAVTADKIAAGAIEAYHIKTGEITAEKIAAKTITAEQLKAGLITADSGLIAVGAIQTAQIADGSITSAKIVSLNADVIESGTLKTDRLLLVGEGGVVYEINAASSGLSQTELSEEQYQHYLNGTVIVARSITAAQIAAETITANEIAANAITAAKINVADLFASEATIHALSAMDITGNTYLRLYVGSQVEEGVNAVNVGGRNYLRGSRSLVYESNYLVARDGTSGVTKVGSALEIVYGVSVSQNGRTLNIT